MVLTRKSAPQDLNGDNASPRAATIPDHTSRGERLRRLAALVSSGPRAAAQRETMRVIAPGMPTQPNLHRPAPPEEAVVQGRFFDSLGDPITSGELEQIKHLISDHLTSELREKWNTEKSSAREMTIWQWFHIVGLSQAISEDTHGDIEAIIGREKSNASANKRITTPEERRMQNIENRIKAREQQLGKDDNSGHGKHYGGLLRGGTKGDRHQTGQARKVNRVKYLTALIARMQADKLGVEGGQSEGKSIQDLLHARTRENAVEIYQEVMKHDPYDAENNADSVEFCQLLYHVGIIDTDVDSETADHVIGEAVETFLQRLDGD